MGFVCALAALGLSCAAEHGGSSDAAAAVGGAAAQVAQPDVPDDYACGGSATCDARYQLCEHLGGGPAALDVFKCEPNPPECPNDRSCACLKAVMFTTRCEGDGGHLTVWVEAD